MRPALILLAIGLAGCKAPVEAPNTLDELCGFLFAHMEDEDPEILQASLANLDTWMNANLAQTLEGYAIENISPEAAEALGKGDLDGLLGAAVGAESVNTVEKVTEALIWENQEELYPETYLEFERTLIEGSYECFTDQSCDWLEVDNTLLSSYPLGITVYSEFIGQYRWLTMEDGRTASVYRTWMTSEPDVSLEAIDIKDQFYLGANIPMEDGRTLRLLASWMLAEIGDLDVPQDFALNLAIDSLITSNDELDTWISENL